MHDIVIRGGLVVDGTGAPAFEGDVAIENGKLVAVGGSVGAGREEIDARDRIVTPGWVDIHSHYDGQVTWDPYVSPSGFHGVTTTVMGNCGVGFAPARPDSHDHLINVMEGVEDIPGTALHEGMRWGWESFPQYLDVLEAMPRVMDIAAQVPHSAVRDYVMGDRGATRAAANADHVEAMARIVEQALRAGAIGFSTSRTKLHLAADGSAVAGSFADSTELLAIGHAMARAGHGVFQMVSDLVDPEAEFAWMEQLARQHGVPVHYILVQFEEQPDKWRQLLAMTRRAAEGGADITALVGCRPVGMLINLESRYHPFSEHPSYRAIAHLPLEARIEALRQPALRARLLAEETTSTNRFWRTRMAHFHNMFQLGDPPDYEPPPERSVEAIARASGRRPEEIVLDILTGQGGRDWLYFPFINYADRSLQPLYDMMRHPHTLLSLADGGAHCGLICDASAPSFLLSHWARDRRRGPLLGLEEAVALQSSRGAAAYGLVDRGRLTAGLRADVNVIDFNKLRLEPPRWAHDLPAQGRRLLQHATGYDATIAAGVVTWRHGEATGALPGRLIRAGRDAA
ncbi:amidohydrolase family protein [Reyranella sp. CPCC 100927]|uniref:N-acyl-D-amino-acid deacylase family protein n=1 Tax=Reyranella sp. CPCC 100927 TaxID=2599616 RepID=UPI0011B415E7|nr:amidohydrolase family protein [Reyranella sp. CPCC 100927]TWS94967.1 amidohydrolase family protein [Reyranella sp. CPCC 100927]